MMNHLLRLILIALVGALAYNGVAHVAAPLADSHPTTQATYDATISGGHETNPRDHGRPVVLIAAALGVKEQVFREAFSHVHPAPAGQEPEPGQVDRNKKALLDALGKYGVTNERLDEVSNFYRYQPGRGENGVANLWRHQAARVKVTIDNGVVSSITIVNAGAGYSTPPKLAVEGHPEVKLIATLAFGNDLAKNGSLKSVKTVE